MKRTPLYSRSGPRAQAAGSLRSKAPLPGEAKPAAAAIPAPAPTARSRPWPALHRHERLLWIAAVVLLALAVVMLNVRLGDVPRPLTQEDIDKAVLSTLQNVPLPSPAAKAYEVIRPSVVRVKRMDGAKGPDEKVTGVGSGVVIVEDGTILTNIHVVAGAPRIGVVFADGSESDASIVAVQPEQDLAVIRAHTVPDDLVPATMRSSADLKPGDIVVAVGFPFGIGPSVSAGVVSGLRRQYESPEGKRLLSNLIQFDAAANPGNSGGPLVTTEGEVVGIVTGILNPTGQRVFAGISFAVPIEVAAGAAGVPPF